jgi:hypothetical protein
MRASDYGYVQPDANQRNATVVDCSARRKLGSAVHNQPVFGEVADHQDVNRSQGWDPFVG